MIGQFRYSFETHSNTKPIVNRVDPLLSCLPAFSARIALVIFLFTLNACDTVRPDCSPPVKGQLVYITEGGWHVQLGLAFDELSGPMSFYKKVFPEAKFIEFGYGKKTFFTSSDHTIDDYILGPFPGPAVIQVFGLTVDPIKAYPDSETIVLRLSEAGMGTLQQHIWDDLYKNQKGNVEVTARGEDPDSLFYASVSEYNLFHTCNTWVAESLRAAGLPIEEGTVIFANQAMNLAGDVARLQCSESH